MSILQAPASPSKPITVAPPSPDPWYEDRTPRPTPPAWLVFGVRVKHTLLPGTWKVVREPARYGNGQDWLVRVREQAADGSLFGPVLSWKVGEVAALVSGIKSQIEPTVDVGNSHIEAEAADKPLAVAMVISIDGTHYGVAPLAPAPDAVKAFRFSKVSGDEARHDIDETAAGASCTCGDFVWRHEGRNTIGCKHLRAARMMGLIGEPPEPTSPDDDRRAAYDDAREKLAALEAAEDAVRREGEARQVEPAPCCPVDEVAPCQACVTHDGPGDLSDDDGWDDDHVWTITQGDERDDVANADTLALDAVCELRADWLVDRPGDDEADESGTLPEWLDSLVSHHRGIGGDNHTWLAGKLAQLADQARFLNAATPDAFDDRLDAEAARIEARIAADRGR